MSFHQQFDSFEAKFTQERSLIRASLSINSKTRKELQDEYTTFINSVALLTRLHYVSHSDRDFTLEEFQNALIGIKPVMTSVAMKIFPKSNSADRYSACFDYLCKNPSIFAQVLYFSMLTPFNFSLASNEQQPFTEDDSIYFCYSTFPAIFNYFMTQSSQHQAIALIKNIFELHLSLHGPNFGKPHKFLSHLITSFFLSTNPGFFFESTIDPLIREYWPKLTNKNYDYSKMGKSDNSLLIRWQYWQNCLSFAVILSEKMIQNAPLLPTAARFLITELASIQTEDFPLSEFFIFESMFFDYLENRYLSHNSTLMRDVCNLIRCSYPQDMIQSPIYSTLAKMNIQHDLFQSLSLKNLMESFKLDTFENDPISIAIENLDEISLFTPRDFTLIRNSIQNILKYIGPQDATKLVSLFQELNPPSTDNDYQYIKVVKWINAKKPVEKLDTKTTQAYDTTVDSLTSINYRKMPFHSHTELSSGILTYCRTMLTLPQKIQINALPGNFVENMDAALNVIQSNREKLHNTSSRLFTSIFSITTEKSRCHTQILNLLSLFVEFRLLPFMIELYPQEFDFHSTDLFSAADSDNALQPVFKAIETFVVPLNLSKEIFELVNKHIFMLYLDQLNKMFDLFSTLSCSKLEQQMTRYNKNHPRNHDESRFVKKLRKKATLLLSSIHEQLPASFNVNIILKVMELLKDLSDNEVINIIIRSLNPAVFGIYFFITKYVQNETLQKAIFTNSEKEYMDRFVVIYPQIRSLLQVS